MKLAYKNSNRFKSVDFWVLISILGANSYFWEKKSILTQFWVKNWISNQIFIILTTLFLAPTYQFTHMVIEFIFVLQHFEAFQTLNTIFALWVLLNNMLFQWVLVPVAFVTKWALWWDFLLVNSFRLIKSAKTIKSWSDSIGILAGERNAAKNTF